MNIFDQEDIDQWPDLGDWDQADFQSPWNSDGDLVFGNPGGDASVWQEQDTNFTCAVTSQQMILHQFGFDVSESELVFRATSNGWLTEAGTSPLDAGRLLESYGIGTHANMNGGVEALIDELSHGRKIVAAVDSGELWGSDHFFSDWINPDGADHALVITGVDLSDADNPMIIVNDPGHPNGAGQSYPLEQFLDAWQDSGEYYVATDGAPPDLESHPTLGHGFDQENEFYKDPSFWASLLAAVTAGYAVAEHIFEGSEAADSSMWEDMTSAAKDELFISI